MRKDASTDRRVRWLLFTDLDGTLLDHDTYRWDEAAPALELCAKLDVPVILVSSKTAAEMNPLRLELGLSFPFIVENGGGIYFPAESPIPPPPTVLPAGDLRKWSLGPPYRDVVAALQEIRRELNMDLRGFSDMAVGEIGRFTGLVPEQARLAAMREYDEPVLHPGSSGMEALVKAASRRNLRVTEGGRFCHLHGNFDKGEALQRLVRRYVRDYGQTTTIALGDGPNDLPMLKRVDYPVLVRSSRKTPGPGAELGRMRTTDKPGPAGWNAAVTAVLTGKWNGGDHGHV